MTDYDDSDEMDEKDDAHAAGPGASKSALSAKEYDAVVAEGDEVLKTVPKSRKKNAGQRIVQQPNQAVDNTMGMASVAAVAKDLPVNDNLKSFFTEYENQMGGHGKPDLDKISNVPGMVVDKKTGDVKLFGLEFLPVPVQYASMLSVGYTLGISLVNRFVFKNAYRFGNKMTTKLGMAEYISPKKAGQAMGLLSIATTTHWPDVNTIIQSEREYGKNARELANELLPMLEDITGKHGKNALFMVTKEQNEVIYNQRRRLMTRHNAERYRNGVQMLGRSAVFAASAAEGYHNIEGLGDVSAEVAQHSKVEDYYKEVSKVQKHVEETMGLTGEKAFAEAKSFVDKQAPVAGKMDVESFKKRTSRNEWMNYGAVGVTLLAQAIGNSIFGSRVSKLQPVSAYDMIKTLRKFLDDDPKQSSFPLPEGMKVEGAKGSQADELKLKDYVIQIFQQHERDCNGDDARIPSRLDEKLDKMAELIAKDLREGKIDGMALVNLVGERKIVRNRGKTVADEKIVRRELDRLHARLRHMEWVDPDHYMAEASFSKDDLKKAWDGMQDDERDVFVSLVPVQALEAAGINGDEVRKRRQTREKQFADDITNVLKGAVALGDKVLKERELTESEIALFHEANELTKEQGSEAIIQVLPGAGRQTNIAQPLTELVVRNALHGGKLRELAQQKEV